MHPPFLLRMSSLFQIPLSSSGHSTSSSTKSNIGWGSPAVADILTPPVDSLEPSVNPCMNSSPILSVDVPILAHHLHEGTLGEHKCNTLHSLFYSPRIHHALEYHLDTNSPSGVSLESTSKTSA